jgi:toxin CptA
MKSVPAIAFEYRPSRWLLAAVVAVAMLAMASVELSGLPTWAKSGLVVFAVTCAGIALGRFWRPLVRRAAWNAAGHWRLIDADGREHVAELVRSVVRGAWIVLNLRRSDGKRIALILGPDNCDADTRRRLRVRLARVQGDIPDA